MSQQALDENLGAGGTLTEGMQHCEDGLQRQAQGAETDARIHFCGTWQQEEELLESRILTVTNLARLNVGSATHQAVNGLEEGRQKGIDCLFQCSRASPACKARLCGSGREIPGIPSSRLL